MSKILTVDQVRAKVKAKSKVLWVYRDNVEDGEVLFRDGDLLALIWLEGYKSRNDDVKVDEVLAIFDKNAPEIEIFPFVGRGYLTEAGQRWNELHPRAE